MKSFMNNKTVIAAVLIACTAAFSCSRKAASPKKTRISWPADPERARVRFVTGFFAQEGLEHEPGFFGSLRRFITGGKSPSLQQPYGLETADDGSLYVVDTGLRKIIIFSKEGRKLGELSADHRLLSPIDIAITGGRIFVTDSARKKVFIIDKKGKIIGSIGEGIFERPTGIAASADGRYLYTVDTAGHCIFRTSPDGKALKRIGKRGSAPGEFNYPTNITVSADGRIIVTDSMNFRIQIMDAGGAPLASIGTAGDGPGTFSKPRGVAVDSEGHIYVVDAMFDNVQVFSLDGTLLLAFGSSGYGPGRFYLPSGIFIDSNDRIFIADTFNRAVQVFDYMPEGNAD